MPQENVEVARRGLEAWSSGDLDAALALVHPEAEFRTSGLFPGVEAVYQGHDGYKRWWNDFRGMWEEIELVPERLLDHGDRVLVFGRFKARGREGITVKRELGVIFMIRDGLATRIETYPSGDQALKAVGLRE